VRLGPPSLAGLQHICSNLRARDRVELDAVMWEESDLKRAERWFAMWRGEAFLGQEVSIGDEAVGCLMLTWISPAALAGGFIATDRWREIAGPFARHCLRKLKPRMTAAGVRRVEARVWEGHTDARRLLEFFGGAVEARLPAFGRNGEGFLQYAWINPDMEAMPHVHGLETKTGRVSTLHH
jgi:hypothetical protein